MTAVAEALSPTASCQVLPVGPPILVRRRREATYGRERSVNAEIARFLQAV